jgi:tetratricopeptide (TPR) repeat protein
MPIAIRLAAAVTLVLAALASGGARAAENAVEQLQAAIAADAARHGATSPRLLPRYEALAQLAFRNGRLDAATAARRSQLTLSIAAYGLASLRTAEAMVALAEAELNQLRYLDAEALLLAAGKAAPNAPTQAAILAGLSRVAAARGEPDAAVRDAEHAVALQPRSAAALRALGAAYGANHRFDDAERVLKQAVAADGDARSLSQLGNLYLHAHRFEDALAPLEEAAYLDRTRLDPNHPFVADDLHDLAIAEDGLKRPGLAAQMLEQALEILRRSGDKTSTRIAYCDLELARIEREAGDTDQADIHHQEGQHLLNTAEDAERDREKKI